MHHIWMSHVSHLTESCQRHEQGMSRIWISFHTYVHMFHTDEGFISKNPHMWISHIKSCAFKRRNVVYWNPNGRSSMISCIQHVHKHTHMDLPASDTRVIVHVLWVSSLWATVRERGKLQVPPLCETKRSRERKREKAKKESQIWSASESHVD